jgi:hypothetical protein
VSRSHQPCLVCRCGHRRDPARVHHDQLLRVATDQDALLALFDLAVTWSELEYPAEQMIPPARWLEFDEEHRWPDPERVRQIFQLATDVAMRAGSGLCAVPDPALPVSRSLTIAGG